MFKKIVKFLIGAIGFVSVFMAIKEFYSDGIIEDNKEIDIAVSLAICTAAFFIFYILSAIVIKNLPKLVDKFELYLKEKKFTSYEFALGCVGFIIGLIIANLICIPILAIKFVGIPITIIANIICAYLGLSVALRYKNDKLLKKLKQRYEDEIKDENTAKLLDTSTIIDGRIFDILLSGFIEGNIIIPQFVVEELGILADSEDTNKRAKGRAGLDMIGNMQKEFKDRLILKDIKIEDKKGKKSSEQNVDELLIETALKEEITIITNDFNLNKIAKIKNINVLNINELANALKPLANVGDEIIVTITKQGKERQQGIGYLESGTMVVVENAKNRIGENVSAVVTSVIQTQAGRMIFATMELKDA